MVQQSDLQYYLQRKQMVNTTKSIEVKSSCVNSTRREKKQ